MRHIELFDGQPTRMPVLGLGTWRFGEGLASKDAEVASIRQAISLGYRLIDTAEMYGEGAAESLVGRALADALRTGEVRREEMFIVSKVYPHNASRTGTAAACERSLKRLGIDQIDLYLLHWMGSHPLAETVDALRRLVEAGKIGRWGVSNLDTDDMQALAAIAAVSTSDTRSDITSAGGGRGPGAAHALSLCATNQVYYSLSERGPEFSLLPWMRERSMPLMAYSPIDQGSLADDDTLADIGRARGISAAQVALAWVVGQPGVVAIPKASSARHLQENLAAADIRLTAAEQRQIESRFPAPRRKSPLAMI